ncbi:biotin-dependent carboxyltransferase family protein [Marinobacter litoralis]|uniref:5-oxoprolinase subunit C family protein n=1 Tax=Marinobacter litoralis TaxID=187981 RepID=UPI0018ED65FB|nr:biotin-dependent carboxyltransferase family protein [Marinobacter litoralis]MBJ6136938.1 biotin-dependent carboxyltransferase [Marinobacter litoralis]
MSAQAGFHVTKPGFFTLLQDEGRRGVMHMGLASGGTMDRHAWAWANHLLGNRYGATALEITFGGATFTSGLNTQIAVTGAEVQLTVNGQQKPLWSTIQIETGDVVALSAPRAGVRCYLAVRGGFVSETHLGNSCATVFREGTGGLHGDGSPLREGDFLPCNATAPPVVNRTIPNHWIPDYSTPLTLDVLLCAQAERFSATARSTFFANTYTLSPQSDRMGARLAGPTLEASERQLISEGTSLGAIQIPADGQPIILLQDRQTVGGYPKLGAVTPRSLDALAQRPPGTRLHFRETTLQSAQQAERQFLTFFRTAR